MVSNWIDTHLMLKKRDEGRDDDEVKEVDGPRNGWTDGLANCFLVYAYTIHSTLRFGAIQH